MVIAASKYYRPVSTRFHAHLADEVLKSHAARAEFGKERGKKIFPYK